MTFTITEHVAKTKRHTTSYLACGAADAPLIIFVHGFPELSISWRHQLPVFAELGFRCVAPDMRGYGRSSVYGQHSNYAVEHSVRDMIELLDSLGREKAVWVGHDWGAPVVVWDVASHHPERCDGVANLCVPYLPKGVTLDNLVPLVDRTLYPESKFPAGQWRYQLFYEENFAKACAALEANPRDTVKALFRKGDAAARGRPAPHAYMRQSAGRWDGADRAPDLPMDADLLAEADLAAYAAAFQRNGFFGPCSWYMNNDRSVDLFDRGDQRRSAQLAGALPSWGQRPGLRYDKLPPGRTDASILCGPDRGGGPIRPLDGAGTAGRGECGIGKMADGEVIPHLDIVMTTGG